MPVLRELIDRWRRADAAERERLVLEDPSWSLLARDVEWRVDMFDWQEVHRGWEGVVEFWARFLESWETFNYEVEEYRDLGDGAVLTTTHARMRGREGIPVKWRAFTLHRVRDGLIVSWQIFASAEEALRAVTHH